MSIAFFGGCLELTLAARSCPRQAAGPAAGIFAAVIAFVVHRRPPRRGLATIGGRAPSTGPRRRPPHLELTLLTASAKGVTRALPPCRPRWQRLACGPARTLAGGLGHPLRHAATTE